MIRRRKYAMHRANRWLWLALVIALPAPGQQPFAWKDAGNGRMELSERGKPVLAYNYGVQLKEGAPEDRKRCCYIFPLLTPAGVSILDDFPKDHFHHHGLFWAWPVVETGGKSYDLWETGTAKLRSAKTPVAGAAAGEARLQAANFWQADGRDIVRESLRLVVFPARDSAREMDVELTWEALGAPVTLRGARDQSKSYGGFCARFAPRENTVLRADGEVLSKDEDLTPRRWAELEAVYGGKRAVLRITPDPADFGAPYQWCLRNYGFVAASFPGKTPSSDGFTLEPGKPLDLKFRVRVGDAR